MKLNKLLILLITVFLASCQKTQNIKISTIQNKTWVISSFQKDSIIIKKNDKPKVLIALDLECPLCSYYSNTINELYHTYKDQMDFYGFLPSVVFVPDKFNDFKKKYNYELDFLIDTNQLLTNALNAKITPECFLLDSNLNIKYQGLIDDRIKEVGRRKKEAKQHYLKNAIQSHLDQRPIKIKKTNAIGCIIER